MIQYAIQSYRDAVCNGMGALIYCVYVCFCTGVNVKTGDVFPSSFTHKGPAEELRSARTFTGGQVK